MKNLLTPKYVEVKLFNEELQKKLGIIDETSTYKFPFKTEGALAFDLFAVIEKPIQVDFNGHKIPTGIAIQSWNDYLEFGVILAIRSSLSSEGLYLKNSLGIIDCVPLTANIKTKNGYVNLEQLIKNYETVISYNVENNHQEEDIINEIWKVGERETIQFEFDDGTSIEVTKSQLILTEFGWKEAITLNLEDEIISV